MTSLSDYDKYKHICLKAVVDEEIFNIFKSDMDYRIILEHVDKETGDKYWDIIKKSSPELMTDDLIKKFQENDRIGNTIKFSFDGHEFSPTTVRYIKVLGDMINVFGSLENLDIVEIGCGYGGQSKIIMEKFNINSYTFIDLDETLKLIEKYMKEVSPDNFHKLKFLKYDNILDDLSFDLCISNYAFSECRKDIQENYLEKILKKSKKGYMIMNFIANFETLSNEDIIKKIPNSFILQENPLTSEHNKLLCWK